MEIALVCEGFQSFVESSEQLREMLFLCRRFHSKFNLLNQEGMPGLVALNDRLISLEKYFQKLYIIATDKASFAGIEGHITGKLMLEALDFDLLLSQRLNTFL